MCKTSTFKFCCLFGEDAYLEPFQISMMEMLYEIAVFIV